MAKFVLRVNCTAGKCLDERSNFVTPDSLADKYIFWNENSMNVFSHKDYAGVFQKINCQTTWNLSQTSLFVCARLFGFEIPTWPPEKYVNVHKQLGDLESFHEKPENYMPAKAFWNSLFEFCRNMSQKLDEADIKYWTDYEVPSSEFFKKLSNAFIKQVDLYKLMTSNQQSDVQFAEQLLRTPSTLPYWKDLVDLLANDSSTTSTIRTFPISSSFSRNSITGRAINVGGTPWLTMKKSRRSIFVSSFSDNAKNPRGKLYTFDYTSLEPRILFYLSQYLDTGNPITPLIGSLPRHKLAHPEVPDIYLKVLDDLGLSGKLPRAMAKQTILSILYGQGEETTVANLKNHISKPEDFVSAVLDYFRVPTLRQTLARDLLYSNRKQIKSFYGRPIICPDTRPSTLLNYYIQATAVDAAILGFRKIQKYINGNVYRDTMYLVGYIHDAVIMDISNDMSSEIPEIEEIGSFGIDGFDGANFYLRSQELTADKPDEIKEEQV